MKNSKTHSGNDKQSAMHLFSLTMIAWFSMVGFDFLVHAGVLAKLYAEPSPFLLAPADAFRLIPVGYLSFLLLAILLTWLMTQMNVTGWKAGALFSLKLGVLIWGSFGLGLLSISTASPSLLLGWFIGQSLEMSLAGSIVGSGLAGTRLRWLLGFVVIVALLSVIVAIVLQNLGSEESCRLV